MERPPRDHAGLASYVDRRARVEGIALKTVNGMVTGHASVEQTWCTVAGLIVLAFVVVGLPNETESSLANLNTWPGQSQV